MRGLKRVLVYFLLVAVGLIALFAGLTVFGFVQYVSRDYDRQRIVAAGTGLPFFYELELGTSEQNALDKAKARGAAPSVEPDKYGGRLFEIVFLGTKKYFLDFEDSILELHIADGRLSEVVFRPHFLFPLPSELKEGCASHFRSLLNDFQGKFGQPSDAFSTGELFGSIWAIPGGHASISVFEKGICMIRARRTSTDFGAHAGCRGNCHLKEAK